MIIRFGVRFFFFFFFFLLFFLFFFSERVIVPLWTLWSPPARQARGGLFTRSREEGKDGEMPPPPPNPLKKKKNSVVTLLRHSLQVTSSINKFPPTLFFFWCGFFFFECVCVLRASVNVCHLSYLMMTLIVPLPLQSNKSWWAVVSPLGPGHTHTHSYTQSSEHGSNIHTRWLHNELLWHLTFGG